MTGGGDVATRPMRSLHDDSASFDRLRMKGNLGGTKEEPHPEPVEGRRLQIQAFCNLLTQFATLYAHDIGG